MKKAEEISWIDSIKSGDMRHFSSLYDRHSEKLYAVCYQFTRNQADAEDQLQEVFLHILSNIKSFKHKSTFSTWATRIAINQLINFQNRNVNKYHETDQSLQLVPAKENTESLELSLSLSKAIFSLPDGFRKAVILHDQIGMQHHEIAELLNISTSTSRSQLHRARIALRDFLKECITEGV